MFSPYFKYCAEQTACQQYCKDQDRDNQVFKAYLAVRSTDPVKSKDLWPGLNVCLLQWCETQRDCNRLRLIDILVRPMQRLTKYSLLLKAVLKKTDDVSQKKDLAEMVGHQYFGREINLSLNIYFRTKMLSHLLEMSTVTWDRDRSRRDWKISSQESTPTSLLWVNPLWEGDCLDLLLHSRKPKMMNYRAYLPQPLI